MLIMLITRRLTAGRHEPKGARPAKGRVREPAAGNVAG
jgi:hypothetical protein